MQTKSIPLVAILLFGCERTVVSRPESPADQVMLVVDGSIPPPQVRGLTDALVAPVSYLGRPESPLRVSAQAALDAHLLRHAATLVVVETQESAPSAEDALRSLPAAALIESHRPDGQNAFGWSTYENAFLQHQTIVRAHLQRNASLEEATSLGRAIRASVDRSQIRHWRQRLLQAADTTWLPKRATGERFRVLLPQGYSWSDTSSAWPASVQIAKARPTRVVTVFWLEDATEAYLQSPEFLVGLLRDAMWRLQRDRLEEDSIEWLPALDGSPQLRAIWQNPERIAGGPMHVLFVYDASRKRLYGVQALVFLPGADKHRALQETVAIASTFEIVETF